MKTLIAYYSWSGRTERAAKKLQASVANSDLLKLTVADDVFDSDMYRTNDIANQQIETSQYPDLTSATPQADQYDLIIVGSPVWSGKPATPLYTFLRSLVAQNYQGKVAGFYTDAGSEGKFADVFKVWANGLDVVDVQNGNGDLSQWVAGLTK